MSWVRPVSVFRAGGRRRRLMFCDAGATAVEAALVTPVVLALFFGIIELGFLFKDYVAVTGAVRAGARIASANPRNSTFAQIAADQVALTAGAINFKDVQQLWVYKAALTTDKPVGFSDFSGCTTCVKFAWDAGTKKFVVSGGSWPSTAQNACSSSTTAGPPDRVGVYLMLRHKAFTGFVFKSVDIAEASILTLEPISTLTGCK